MKYKSLEMHTAINISSLPRSAQGLIIYNSGYILSIMSV